MNQLKSNLQHKGYLTVPHFLPAEEVNFIRNEIERLLEQDKDFTLKPTTLLSSRTLCEIIFSQKFKTILDMLSDQYKYFIPNFTARKNLYIGWHSDDEFVEQDKGDLPSVLQCNIYLQDNSLDFGGGIDVGKDTHYLSPAVKKEMILKDNVSFESAPTQAGDLLIFDYRAVHRSTIPAVAARDSARLALQWTVCQSFERASMFMEYLVRRQKEKLHLSDFTDKRALSYFFDAMNVHYPDSFQNFIIQQIEKLGIIIPSVEEMVVIQ